MKTKYEIGMGAYEEYMETNCSSAEISKKYGNSRTWLDSFIRNHGLPRNKRNPVEDNTAQVLIDTYNYWVENGGTRVSACRKFGISESRFSHFMKRRGLK